MSTSCAASRICDDKEFVIVAKLAAGRDKDKIFIRELLRHDLVKIDVITKRLEQTQLMPAPRQAMESLLKIIEVMG